MEDNKYEQLKKDVYRMNEEGFVPEGQQLHIFRNANDLIQAIRNNEIPNIPWTEEDEAKWQAAEAIDKAFEESEEVETRTDEFNTPGNMDFSVSEIHDRYSAIDAQWKSGTPEEFLDDIEEFEWTEEEWTIWHEECGDLDDDTIIQ